MEESVPELSYSGSLRARQLGRRALILFFLLYPLTLSLLLVGRLESRMMYAYSHLFLTYSHGFARRSLYGTLFQTVPFISARLALFAGRAEVVTAVLLTYALFARHFLSSYRDASLFCFLFGGCALLPHLGLIYGYLDVVLYSLLIITIFVIYGFKDHTITSLFLVSAITVLGLLVHEAYLLMFYPVIFVLLLLETKPTRSSRAALAFHFVFVACSFLLIVLKGKPTIGSEAYFTLAKTRTNMPILDLVFGQMHSNLRDQMATSMHFYLKPATMLLIVVSLAVALPYLLVLRALFFATFSKTQLECKALPEWVLKLTPFLLITPLLLVFVGFDLMRWLSCACTNLTLFVACRFCFASNSSEAKSALRTITGRDWFLAGLLAMIVIGPFGIVLGNRIFERMFSCGSWWFCV